MLTKKTLSVFTLALSMIALGVLSGCSNRTADFSNSPRPPLEGDEKARAEFLAHPVVKEFQSISIEVDCDFKVCANVSSTTLSALRKFKLEFSQRIERITAVDFVINDKPFYDYRLKKVYLPYNFKSTGFQAFFDLFRGIEQLEKDLGFRIEFTETWYVSQSIEPLRDVLIQNMEALKAAAPRINILVINARFNQYYPAKKILGIKSDNLMESFEDIWAFDQVLFKAHDVLGDSSFLFQYGDSESLNTLLMMIDRAEAFAPLLKQLKFREFEFSEIKEYAYNPASTWDKVIRLSNQFNAQYILAVLEDLRESERLVEQTGVPFFDLSYPILLEGRKDCLDKFGGLSAQVAAKKKSILMVSLVRAGDKVASQFEQGQLVLNCGDTLEQWAQVTDSIP
jgi:hypothetical protein